jgi:hypothetical protein
MHFCVSTWTVSAFFVALFKTSHPIAIIPDWLNVLPGYAAVVKIIKS